MLKCMSSERRDYDSLVRGEILIIIDSLSSIGNPKFKVFLPLMLKHDSRSFLLLHGSFVNFFKSILDGKTRGCGCLQTMSRA